MLRPPRLLLIVAFSCLGLTAPAAPADVAVERGTINGAHYAVAGPAGPWTGGLLLLAHGHRATSAPLVADLFPDHAAYRALLDEGWIVAKTSYRRNGLIIADAIADLDALRRHVASTHGEPRLTLLEGESMGGTIVTHLAERGGDAYAGAVAIGAALHLVEPDGAPPVHGSPRLPLIFLTNRSELAGPAAYVAAATDAPVPPLLLHVDRDGHVNVNQAERLVALRTLLAWIEHGRDAAVPAGVPPEAPHRDVTQTPVPSPSRVAFAPDGRAFTATAVEVSGVYGNIWLDAQPADFATIGVSPGDWLELVVDGTIHPIRYGTDFGSVARGEWVVFPNADGFCWLALNWGNAAATAGLARGDAVTLRRPR